MYLVVISIQLILARYNFTVGDPFFNSKFPVKEIINFLLNNNKTPKIDEGFWDEVTIRFTEDEIEKFNLIEIEIMFHSIIDELYTVVRFSTGLPDIDFDFVTWSGNDILLKLNDGKNTQHYRR